MAVDELVVLSLEVYLSGLSASKVVPRELQLSLWAHPLMLGQTELETVLCRKSTPLPSSGSKWLGQCAHPQCAVIAMPPFLREQSSCFEVRTQAVGCPR